MPNQTKVLGEAVNDPKGSERVKAVIEWRVTRGSTRGRKGNSELPQPTHFRSKQGKRFRSGTKTDHVANYLAERHVNLTHIPMSPQD